MEYVEQNCCIEHDGKHFCSGGAAVSEQRVVAYIGKPSTNVTDWHGNVIGTCRMVSAWPIRSFMSDTMFQAEVTINGVVYTGRTLGAGMIFVGKRKAKQS